SASAGTRRARRGRWWRWEANSRRRRCKSPRGRCSLRHGRRVGRCGQVVADETGRPLAGGSVFAWWAPGGARNPLPKVARVAEAETRTDGKFELAPWEAALSVPSSGRRRSFRHVRRAAAVTPLSVRTRDPQEEMTTALFTVFVLLMAGAADAAFEPPGEGPWRGTIVDAETKQPLVGVVVLAVWNERYGGSGGHGGGGYFDSEEVVTGSDGTFTIRRPKRSFNPFTIIHGPDFSIFKPGYGGWHFQGDEEWLKLRGDERDQSVNATWQRFNSDEGVVIELPPLKTRDARLNFLRNLILPASDMPAD